MKNHFGFNNATVTRFRMWKSGKKWLFGASILTSMFLFTEMKTLALEEGGQTTPSALVTPVLSQDNNLRNANLENVEVTQSVSDETLNHVSSPIVESKVTEEETIPDQTKQAVRVHYEPDHGDNANYYLYVWESGISEQDNHFVPMSRAEDGKWKGELSVSPDKELVNYIIVNNNDWNNANKATGDMVAPINGKTATDVFHGHFTNEIGERKEYYSHFFNVQSNVFDETFGYTDKKVSADTESGFSVVGSEGALGATLNENGTAKVNLWAPTAEKVKINFYESSNKGAGLLKSYDMTRGTVKNTSDHTQNTIGLWSFDITEDILNENGLDTADGLTYDYSLTFPNSYFIQKSQVSKKVMIDGQERWILDYYQYRNSATKQLLNATSEEERQKTGALRVGAVNKEEVAKFYLNDKLDGKKQVYHTVRIQDPYSVAVVQDGGRSVILNPYKKGQAVTVSNNIRVTSKTEMSVLEVDVRDFSIDEKSGITDAKRGNFLGMVERDTKHKDTGHVTGLDYLNYLGVNYVQVMPVYDFQTVPELDKDNPENLELSKAENHGVHHNQQNWGYDPKNYNVPEGSYATDPAQPENRIIELKAMVQGLHDAGINVIMDVVYNHLYDGQENPFEWTVPGYFYGVQPNGAMNNDVGVGNVVRTNSEMMRQYIRNSIIYWMKAYGMDGFRFDAMSSIDAKTLNDVRAAIDLIDPKIVTFGEGWDSMGKYLAKDNDIPASIGNARFTPKYGFFDAASRDSIAGSAYDHGPGHPGFVNSIDGPYGKSSHIENATHVAKSLLGGLDRSYLDASQQLNYIEVHDGMTLSDLMKSYNPTDTEEQHLNRVGLATAMSALAQGIHFSQHGQEFLRTKWDGSHYLHNTYNGGDVNNKINWKLVKDNIDLVNFTKSLISLRKAESLWHLSDYEDIKTKMTVTNAQNNSGIITFELKEDNGDKYLVVFNNNTAPDRQLTLGGDHYYYNVNNDSIKINEGNDFTNAYVVMTNSKNLYHKIGMMNGDKTITFDHLSASILYIPAPDRVTPITVKQTIHYVDKQGHKLETENIQEVTYVKVDHNDPSSKFTYGLSGVPTANQLVLGNRENVLVATRDDIDTTTKYYYARDMVTKEVVTTPDIPQLLGGIPVNTTQIEWIEGVFTSRDVVHPSVDHYKVVGTTATDNDLEKVSGQELAIDDSLKTITVTYAKDSAAVIYSMNDPENVLPRHETDKVEDYYITGYEGELITFDKSNIRLERPGYSYTVNGKQSLDEALDGHGQFASVPSLFEVLYTPNDAKLTIRYVDRDNGDALVKEDSFAGKTDEKVEVSIEFPDNYRLENADVEKNIFFDNLSDTTTVSQIVTIPLKHKKEQTSLTTQYDVVYQGVVLPTNRQKVSWIVEKDLVTLETLYTPQESVRTITSPDVEGYRPDISESVFDKVEESLDTPESKTVTVTYTKVEKPISQINTIKKFIVSGQEYDSLPDVNGELLLVDKMVEEGKEATYVWNGNDYLWKEVTPSLDKVERFYYKVATQLVPLVTAEEMHTEDSLVTKKIEPLLLEEKPELAISVSLLPGQVVPMLPSKPDHAIGVSLLPGQVAPMLPSKPELTIGVSLLPGQEVPTLPSKAELAISVSLLPGQEVPTLPSKPDHAIGVSLLPGQVAPMLPSKAELTIGVSLLPGQEVPTLPSKAELAISVSNLLGQVAPTMVEKPELSIGLSNLLGQVTSLMQSKSETHMLSHRLPDVSETQEEKLDLIKVSLDNTDLCTNCNDTVDAPRVDKSVIDESLAKLPSTGDTDRISSLIGLFLLSLGLTLTKKSKEKDS